LLEAAVSDLSDLVDEQLAELNERASAELEDLAPAPPGLPPAGSWIRAYQLDDDAIAHPRGPWHVAMPWDPRGRRHFSVRCSTRPSSAISLALAIPGYGRSPRTRGLLVALDRPAEGACARCVAALERDVAQGALDARRAELERILPVVLEVGSIAIDPAIEDAERGRRLRELWPENDVQALRAE
jgi:hypothetical protein